MKPLTLNQKRSIAGMWLVVFVFAVGNEYFKWGFLGGLGAPFRSAVMFVGVMAMMKFGPKMIEEMEAIETAKRKEEETAERARDRSDIAAETDRLRLSIGMSASGSRELPSQQSVRRDRREDATSG